MEGYEGRVSSTLGDDFGEERYAVYGDDERGRRAEMEDNEAEAVQDAQVRRDFSAAAGDAAAPVAPAYRSSGLQEPSFPSEPALKAPTESLLSPKEKEEALQETPVSSSVEENKPEPQAAPTKTAASSGSADENLFSSPAASEPLMHSSAESSKDLKEQSLSTEPSGEEVVLEPVAAFSSLSALSTDSLKEPFVSKNLVSVESLPVGVSNVISHEPSKRNAMEEVLTDISESSKIVIGQTEPLNTKPELMQIIKNDKDSGEQHSENEPGSSVPTVEKVSEQVAGEQLIMQTLTKLTSDLGRPPVQDFQASHTRPAADFPSTDECLKDRDFKEFVSDSKAFDEHQKVDVDLKIIVAKDDHESKRVEDTNLKTADAPVQVENEAGSFAIGVTREQEEKYPLHGGSKEQKQQGLEIESCDKPAVELQTAPVGKTLPVFAEECAPVIPKILTKDSSQAFDDFATIKPTVCEDTLTKVASLGMGYSVESEMPENTVKEERAKSLEDHASASVMTVPLESAVSSEQASNAMDSLPVLSADSLSNVPESHTPDLVQGAFECELHDLMYTKTTDESTVDLVQVTPELAQEPLNPQVQLSQSSSEGSEATPSPVLPDIIMEAPLNFGPNSSEISAAKLVTPESSLFEDIFKSSPKVQAAVESQISSAFEEVVNVSVTKPETAMHEAGVVDVITLKEVELVSAIAEEHEDLKTPVACDLIKEVEVLKESVSRYEEKPSTIHQQVSELNKPWEEKMLNSKANDLFVGSFMSEVVPSEKASEIWAPCTVEHSVYTLPPSLPVTQYNNESKGLPDMKMEPYQKSPQVDLEVSQAIPACTIPTAVQPTEIEAVSSQLLEMLEEDFIEHSSGEAISRKPEVLQENVPLSSVLPSVYTNDELEAEHPIDHKEAAVVSSKISSEQARKADEEMVAAAEVVRQYEEIKAEAPISNVFTEPEVKNSDQEDKMMIEAVPSLPEMKKEAIQEKPTKTAPAEYVAAVYTTTEDVSDVEKSGAPVEAAEVELSPITVERKKGKDSAVKLSGKLNGTTVVDLIYWRDIKKTGVVFGASLFLLLSLTVFSIVSVASYIGLALLSMTISFRIYKGVLQAIQKSEEGHPFKSVLDSDVAVSQDLVHKYSDVALRHMNCTLKELRRLFLVEDLVDSLKFAVLMWVLTYVGALFNGLTLLILALISLFSIPVIYERHQAQIDHYLELVNKQVKDVVAKIQAKVPGLKRKTE
ncbi:reticulon-4 isoform X1 [Latimeria chalumnae]|uniref:reticulon-4 isoform X1 n=1 Tax=Latimeria chalumnae TaxID=7897 RepID=UPI0003C18AC9|nr:PREDICTED: reticulon-4 isoform X2 [Latimeria chalumnae]|eukprot:XP_006001600.1 PREDICTED: reticulon-4 isoform X2 [Latimeria chalumnae]